MPSGAPPRPIALVHSMEESEREALVSRTVQDAPFEQFDTSRLLLSDDARYTERNAMTIFISKTRRSTRPLALALGLALCAGAAFAKDPLVVAKWGRFEQNFKS